MYYNMFDNNIESFKTVLDVVNNQWDIKISPTGKYDTGLLCDPKPPKLTYIILADHREWWGGDNSGGLCGYKYTIERTDESGIFVMEKYHCNGSWFNHSNDNEEPDEFLFWYEGSLENILMELQGEAELALRSARKAFWERIKSENEQ